MKTQMQVSIEKIYQVEFERISELFPEEYNVYVLIEHNNEFNKQVKIGRVVLKFGKLEVYYEDIAVYTHIFNHCKGHFVSEKERELFLNKAAKKLLQCYEYKLPI